MRIKNQLAVIVENSRCQRSGQAKFFVLVRGYISQELFEKLYEQGLQLITRRKKNMKQKLIKLIDKILLRKRALIETVNDQLKNIGSSVLSMVFCQKKSGCQPCCARLRAA